MNRGVTDDVVQLQSRLQEQLTRTIADFHLARRDDGLVLQGYARSYYAKQLAQHVTMEATSAPIAANEIVVSR